MPQQSKYPARADAAAAAGLPRTQARSAGSVLGL